ncbi:MULTISPECIES: hypothetical protein [Niastella]|uniref:Uncharacterized protein n=1 Tax=Niastella soli TaxID=2821487 RepID=A0ABS3YS83_9BACT|nr:hypothetical protein [Niastella soli]MBO9200766.1 hypothetical protein [Niastella soli]
MLVPLRCGSVTPLDGVSGWESVWGAEYNVHLAQPRAFYAYYRLDATGRGVNQYNDEAD